MPQDTKNIHYIAEQTIREKLSQPHKPSEPVRHRPAQGAMFQWRDKNKQAVDTRQMTDWAVKELIGDALKRSDAMETVQLLKPSEATIAATLIVTRHTLQGTSAKLGFKIGNKRLYVIKDLGRFLQAFKDASIITYGKNFTFIHKKDWLNDKGKALFTLLCAYYSRESNRQLGHFYYESVDIDKYLYLSESAIDSYMALCLEEGWVQLETNTLRGSQKTPVLNQDPLLTLKVTPFGSGWQIELKEKITLLEGAERLYIILGEREQAVYALSETYTLLARDFLKRLIQNGGVFTIMQQDMQAFYTMVLDPLSQYMVFKDGGALKAFAPGELTSRVYFDVEPGDVVVAKVCFDYGQGEVEGFLEKDMRRPVNMQAERHLEGFLKHYLPGYDAKRNCVLINDDEDAIFRLFDQGLEAIAKEAEIYATDAFKKFTIRPVPHVAVGVRVSEALLEMDFDLEGIALDELKDVLASYRRAKRYHRLHDGSFLKIADNAVSAFLSMADGLDLSDRQLKGGRAKLPGARALYLDMLLKESGGLAYNRDDSFKQLVRDIRDVDDLNFTVPASLRKVLRNYQKTGFRWLKTLSAYGFGGILADDMGLGKTLQVIALLLSYHEEAENRRPSIVICPSSLVLNWQSEINRFAPKLKVVCVSGDPSAREKAIDQARLADVVITSYELMRRDAPLYQSLDFYYAVIDEAQNIKNHVTQNAKSVKTIKSQVRLALTGTPVENNLSELWSIFDFLMPGYLFTYPRFRKRYEEPIVRDESKTAFEGLKKLVSPFILRRMKKDVLKELPEKTETIMYASMEGEQQRLYLANLLEMRHRLKSDDRLSESRIEILAMLTRLRQLCCDPSLVYDNYQAQSSKGDLCMELVKNSIEGGHRVLIFSQFTTMLDRLANQLSLENIDYDMLTGNTPVQQRLSLVNQFNAGTTPVFLISLKAGGTGLNLTGADVVIHYDPWWNKSAQNQATDRVYRIGQTNKVQVYQLIMKDSIEERIMALQARKAALADAVVQQDGTALLSKMSQEEILSLFM